MEKYIIDTYNPEDLTAGFKARKDIDLILIKQGFKKINIAVGKNKKAVFKEVLRIKKEIVEAFERIEENSLIIFQYPWGTLSYDISKEIKKLASQKKCKTIVIIHDLNSVRTGSTFTRLYYTHYVKEIEYLDLFDAIICHNDNMKKYLMNKGVHKKKIISLNIFDYLLENSSANYKNKNFRVVNVAGNLSKDKTKYIYEIPKIHSLDYQFDFYGPFYEGPQDTFINYKGAFSSDDLPRHLQEGFGLVWDGDTINTCSGHFGRYLRINNPHKLSLYMACGIPVIVWRKAAVADFVKKCQVGYCIDSLSEIENIIRKMTPEKYNILRKNVNYISEKVRNGYYISSAILRAEQILGVS